MDSETSTPAQQEAASPQPTPALPSRLTRRRDNAAHAPAWKARENALARLLAMGLSQRQAALRVRMTEERVRGYMRDELFRKHVENIGLRIADRVEDEIATALRDIELEAVQNLWELAEKAKSEEVRLKATISILDRAGQRGAPAQRIQQQVATLDMNKPLPDQVRAALADPGVQQLLHKNPQLQRKLLQEPHGEPSQAKTS